MSAVAFEIEPEYEETLTPGRLLAMAVLWVVSLLVLLPVVSDEWKRDVWRPEDRHLAALPPPTLKALRARHEYLLDRLFARDEVIERSSPLVWNWKSKTTSPRRDDPETSDFWVGGRQDFDRQKARQALSTVFMTQSWVGRLESGLEPRGHRYVMVTIGGRLLAAHDNPRPDPSLSLEVSRSDGDRLEYVHTSDCHDRTLGILRAILETNREAIRLYGTRDWP